MSSDLTLFPNDAFSYPLKLGKVDMLGWVFDKRVHPNFNGDELVEIGAHIRHAWSWDSRERERGRKGGRERGREAEGERECVSALISPLPPFPLSFHHIGQSNYPLCFSLYMRETPSTLHNLLNSFNCSNAYTSNTINTSLSDLSFRYIYMYV